MLFRSSKDYAERPHIFDISQFCFQQQLNEEIDEDEANAVFPDPDEGLTVKVRFSEASIGKTKFPEASRIDFSPRAKPISDKMLAASPNLDEMLIIPSYASLEAMFFGGLDKEAADAEAEDDDWDEDSYDDEDVSDDDDWDDEDEVEAPAPKKGKAKPAPKKPAAKATPKKGRAKAEVAEGECPHGHTFGEDCEEYDECDTCDVWEECFDAKG